MRFKENRECALIFPCKHDNFAYFKGPLQQNSLTFVIISLSVLRIWATDIVPAADTVTVQVRVKLLLGLPIWSMLSFVFAWSPWWYWVPCAWCWRVYCLLNCLHSAMGEWHKLYWRVALAVYLTSLYTTSLRRYWNLLAAYSESLFCKRFTNKYTGNVQFRVCTANNKNAYLSSAACIYLHIKMKCSPFKKNQIKSDL